MTKWLVLVALVTGCGNDCDKLEKKMCEGQDDATCTAMKKWFEDDFLTGPKKEKLSSDEASMGCKMILDDDKVAKTFIERAKEAASKQK
jgi:murein endopeptidase